LANIELSYFIIIRTRPTANNVIYPTPNNFDGGLKEIVSKSKKKNPLKNAAINKAELADNTPFSHVSPEVVNKIKPAKNPKIWSKTEITGAGFFRKNCSRTCNPNRSEIAKAISGNIIKNSLRKF